MAKKGERIEGVERYPTCTIKLSPDLANQFNAKLEAEGSNKNAKIKSWIADYLAGKLK